MRKGEEDDEIVKKVKSRSTPWRYMENLSTGWRRVVSFTPRPFYPRRKSLWCLL